MCYKDIRLNQLFRIYIDGIPLDLTSSTLPFYTRFSFSMLSHIHLHAKSQKHFENKSIAPDNHKMSRFSLLGLIDNLTSAVKKMKLKPKKTEWGNYYQETNYSSDALNHKKQVINLFLDQVKPKSVWDLGGNVGLFSRLASDQGIKTISFDIDPVAVENSYIECVKKDESNILPLLLDLNNPSSGMGWENRERMSLQDRGPADTVFALALIHHLAISNNVPLIKIAEYFNNLCDSLIIEFVPKSDSQVQKLLSTREDVFPDYQQSEFEIEFKKYFQIESSVAIKDSKRTLYLMRNKRQPT